MSKAAIEHYYSKEIRDKCVHILSSRVPQDLHVEIGKTVVTTSSLAEVANAIKGVGTGKSISVGYYNRNKPFVDEKGYALLPPGDVDQNPGRMAWYSPLRNELWLTKWPNKVEYEAMVIHEATHAVFDRNRWSTSVEIAEASAHVAEGWFLWKAGFKSKPKSREDFMIRAAQIFAFARDPKKLAAFKAKHKTDWKQRLERVQKQVYQDLVNDLGTSYANMDEITQMDG